MKTLFVIIFTFIFQLFVAQTVSPLQVIPLDSNLKANEQLFNYVSNYKFILIGEMHGTQEPVKFLVQFAKLLSEKRNVCVGFEIADDETNVFKQSQAGKNSQSWFDAIFTLSKQKNIDVFFYDATFKQSSLNRDSAMYLNVMKQYYKDTSFIILTISGNIHNQLYPKNNLKTMGSFLEHNFKEKVLAVNHQYSYGTMYNKTQDGLKLRTIKEQNNVLKNLSSTENYFYCDTNFEFSKLWNAFLFTTKINAAFPVKND
ncbi:MAG: hypothetical protein KF900_10215 [Bacteroidetes bacterium]|nr:hypothetical protein [Bacteroidota bacterium]